MNLNRTAIRRACYAQTGKSCSGLEGPHVPRLTNSIILWCYREVSLFESLSTCLPRMPERTPCFHLMTAAFRVGSCLLIRCNSGPVVTTFLHLSTQVDFCRSRHFQCINFLSFHLMRAAFRVGSGPLIRCNSVPVVKTFCICRLFASVILFFLNRLLLKLEFSICHFLLFPSDDSNVWSWLWPCSFGAIQCQQHHVLHKLTVFT